MTAMATPRHRVAVTVAQMRDLAGSVTDASVWSMDAAETTTTLIELSRLKAQVAELEARVAEHADDEAVDAWAPDPADQARGARPSEARPSPGHPRPGPRRAGRG